MIYVEMLGRMGNQMFSYAFARTLQLDNKRQLKEKIAFDFSKLSENEKLKYTGELNELRYFKCNNNITIKERQMSFVQRIVLYIFSKLREKEMIKGEIKWDILEKKWSKVLNFFGIYVCSFNYTKFNKNCFFKNLLVIGFFESPLFFEKYDGYIKEEFQLTSIFSNKISNLIKLIESKESVCVGIRKGDFEDNNNSKNYSVCGVNYYCKAIKIMNEKLKSPTYFVFTDDVSWTRSNFIFPDNSIFIIDKKYEIAPHEKLHVMSKCKHTILPNSTYNWWAQHLSDFKDKIVIAPSKWRNITPETHTAIYESGWIIITPE